MDKQGLFMKTIKEIKRNVKKTITIDIPDSMTGEDVEVIIVPLRQDEPDNTSVKPSDFRGAIKTGLSIEEIAEECRKMRDEWDRGF
jgi:hypothetical protein